MDNSRAKDKNSGLEAAPAFAAALTVRFSGITK